MITVVQSIAGWMNNGGQHYAPRCVRVVATMGTLQAATQPCWSKLGADARFGRQYLRQSHSGRSESDFDRYSRVLEDDLELCAAHLWRAVDQQGAVIDILVQPKRDRFAAMRFFRKLLQTSQCGPRVIITDKLRSYGAAKKVALPRVAHRQSRCVSSILHELLSKKLPRIRYQMWNGKWRAALERMREIYRGAKELLALCRLWKQNVYADFDNMLSTCATICGATKRSLDGMLTFECVILRRGNLIILRPKFRRSLNPMKALQDFFHAISQCDRPAVWASHRIFALGKRLEKPFHF
jgi:hypothetical protein